MSATNLQYLSKLPLVNLIETAITDINQGPHQFALASLRFFHKGMGLQLHWEVVRQGRYTTSVAGFLIDISIIGHTHLLLQACQLLTCVTCHRHRGLSLRLSNN